MANCGRDGVAIDIEVLPRSLDALLSENFVMPPECCIFKTPNILSRHNEKAYAPNAFSIGPWHFGKPHLKATQKIKKKYFRGLIDRLEVPGKVRQLEDAIKENEKKARDCYEGPVEFTTEDLVKVLVLDGCFIIELFRKYTKVVPIDEDDPIFTMSCMFPFLYHDLILLENQIPWFVLEHLFDMTKTPESLNPLDIIAIRFFNSMVPSQFHFSKDKLDLPTKSKHILDLLRNWLISSLEEKEPNQTLVSGENERVRVPGLPSATSLRNAGIKFKKHTSKCMLDIQFREGVFEIPPLIVDDLTETLFRNLISFEQCAPNYKSRITSYAKLMDQLIENAKDMEILCNNKIIDNYLTLENAGKFFDRLYIDTFVKEFYYADLCNRMNQNCQLRWPRWRANLMHNYFNNPWAVVGIVVAGLILLLTIIGTVCSIIQAKYAK